MIPGAEKMHGALAQTRAEGEITRIRSRISNALDQMEATLSRMTDLGDKMFGPEPQPVRDSEGCGDAPRSGMLPQLEDQITSMLNLVERTHEQVTRLEKLA